MSLTSDLFPEKDQKVCRYGDAVSMEKLCRRSLLLPWRRDAGRVCVLLLLALELLTLQPSHIADGRELTRIGL